MVKVLIFAMLSRAAREVVFAPFCPHFLNHRMNCCRFPLINRRLNVVGQNQSAPNCCAPVNFGIPQHIERFTNL
jgi:hypothetical protein